MAPETKEWIDGFLVVGNQPVLDLLNTALVNDSGPIELLSDAAALARWFVASGLVTAPKLKASLREWGSSEEANGFLREVLEFRERLRAAVFKFESGKSPGTDFLDRLNELQLAHPVRVALVAKKGGIAPEQAFGPSMPDNLWSLIAAHAADLFINFEPWRVRKCESCVVHFYDVSKKGTRRWCSMALCGNKVKVAAYQKRRRVGK